MRSDGILNLWEEPWTVVWKSLAQGKIDLLVAADYSKAKEKAFDFTRETLISTWGQIYGSRKKPASDRCLIYREAPWVS
jgi:hypothetical protein